MTGLELAAELHRGGARTRVIILTTFARAGYLRRALEAGATGYVLKDTPSEKLADAVRRVHAGAAGGRPGAGRRRRGARPTR